MGNDITGTYSQAKLIFDTLELYGYSIVDIDTDSVHIFRKHLVEMQKRKGSSKRFATRLLNKHKVKVTRIE